MYYIVLITKDGIGHCLPDVYGNKNLAIRIAQQEARNAEMLKAVQVVMRCKKMDKVIAIVNCGK